MLSFDHSILGELFTIKAIVFYASCALVMFLCTASKQTQRIRPHLFIAAVVNYYLETQALYFTEWLLFADHVVMISLLRKVFVCSVCVALGFTAWRFRDYHELSYEVAMQNQSILCVVMQHLRRRAVQEHLDTSDLDSALSLVSPGFRDKLIKDLKIDLKQAAPSCIPDLVPALERMEELESKHSHLTPIFEECHAVEEQAQAGREENGEDDRSSSSGIEQVTEEPCESVPEPPESPRCTAIAKKSGVQCKNSARKCRSHRAQIQL